MISSAFQALSSSVSELSSFSGVSARLSGQMGLGATLSGDWGYGLTPLPGQSRLSLYEGFLNFAEYQEYSYGPLTWQHCLYLP